VRLAGELERDPAIDTVPRNGVVPPVVGRALEKAIGALRVVGTAPEWIAPLALHARRVQEENERLHLTTITEPEAFVRRHVEESLEGLAEIDPAVSGRLLDLGSGNGYPAIPLAVARPGLRVTLTEASRKKAEFLSDLAGELGLANLDVLHRHVQRPGDLPEPGPFDFLTCRAMGSWERVLPRMAPVLAKEGKILLWAGAEVETIRRREVWRRYRLEASHPLPGLDTGSLFVFVRAST
jgi:16S rRNA (guanine527-N7)-methyltransferase